jgi:hypothetical protein
MSFGRCCIQNECSNLFFPTLEELNIKIKMHMGTFAYMFTTFYKMWSIFDFFLENYVDNHKEFVDMILDEEICPDATSYNLVQILARITNYMSLDEVFASKLVKI